LCIVLVVIVAINSLLSLGENFPARLQAYQRYGKSPEGVIASV